MELMSSIFTVENLCGVFGPGTYACARCSTFLYDSSAKWRGPCVWASFREGANLELRVVQPYNNYSVDVAEVYCAQCKLFIGHRFEDGVEKGDTHPAARYRQ